MCCVFTTRTYTTLPGVITSTNILASFWNACFALMVASFVSITTSTVFSPIHIVISTSICFPSAVPLPFLTDAASSAASSTIISTISFTTFPSTTRSVSFATCPAENMTSSTDFSSLILYTDYIVGFLSAVVAVIAVPSSFAVLVVGCVAVLCGCCEGCAHGAGNAVFNAVCGAGGVTSVSGMVIEQVNSGIINDVISIR